MVKSLPDVRQKSEICTIYKFLYGFLLLALIYCGGDEFENALLPSGICHMSILNSIILSKRSV